MLPLRGEAVSWRDLAQEDLAPEMLEHDCVRGRHVDLCHESIIEAAKEDPLPERRSFGLQFDPNKLGVSWNADSQVQWWA